MNSFVECIDGFAKPKIYYGDTDSIYISKDNWEILNKNGFVGNNLGQGKNDYGDGGIVFGLYLAPKVKYNIVLKEDLSLEEKITFKGYTKEFLKVENFFDLAAGKLIQQEMPKNWKRSMETGIFIPDDTQLKRFKADINLLKRKTPDENFVMWPYGNKDETDFSKFSSTDMADNFLLCDEIVWGEI